MKKTEKLEAIHSILTELFPNPICELNHTHDYELLFAVIMSAQTTDKQVNVLTKTLFNIYPTLRSFAEEDIETLAQNMNSIGLYKSKAKYLNRTANILLEKYNGKIPQSLDQIQSLPGAARKTANVVMWELFGMNEGMAVDTHVMRLAYRLGLTKWGGKLKPDPLKIEQDLIQALPQDQWGNFGHRLILYGRYYWPAHKQTHDGPLNQFARAAFRNPNVV